MRSTFALTGLLLLALTIAVPASAKPMNNATTRTKTGTTVAATVAAVGQTAPDFTLTDANGESVKLSQFAGKTVVLEWINFGCPFVRAHYDKGHMQKLQKTMADSGVVWLSICTGSEGKQGYYSGQALKDQLKKEGWAGKRYLLDTTGAVGKLYDAKTTPHMYVIGSDTKLGYAGAIDDKPSAKPADHDAAQNYVVGAVKAIQAGLAVDPATTQAYGCGVKYP